MKFPEGMRVESDINEYFFYEERQARRLYLLGEIADDDDSDCSCLGSSKVEASSIVRAIMNFNREDQSVPESDRKPILLYIDSPGGDVQQGFSIVSTIKRSKTPVYTICFGLCASMAFHILIAGKKRFALPYTTLLLHEGIMFTGGNMTKVQDHVEFEKRFNHDVVRSHVLNNSRMSVEEYDKKRREEFYMLPEDALGYGFIDKVVYDMDEVL